MPSERFVNMVTRELLVSCIAPGGKCACGLPAVVIYRGSSARSTFAWPRCGSCHGARRAWDSTSKQYAIRGFPLEPHHRRLLALIGDEATFVSALRLGWRPEARNRGEPDGEVDLDPTMWDAQP